MVDSIQTLSSVSIRVPPVNNTAPASENKNGTEISIAVYSENEPEKVAQPLEQEFSDNKEVKECKLKIKPPDRKKPEKEDKKGLPYSRYYSVEDSEFILKVYDNQGRLVNKIPPGYLTLKDRDLVNLYV